MPKNWDPRALKLMTGVIMSCPQCDSFYQARHGGDHLVVTCPTCGTEGSFLEGVGYGLEEDGRLREIGSAPAPLRKQLLELLEHSRRSDASKDDVAAAVERLAASTDANAEAITALAQQIRSSPDYKWLIMLVIALISGTADVKGAVENVASVVRSVMPSGDREPPPRQARNEPCACGSGAKHKYCCGSGPVSR